MGYVFLPKGAHRQTWMMKYYVQGRAIVESTKRTNQNDARTVLYAREAAQRTAAAKVERTFDPWCYVYFIAASADDTLVKIGRARDPRQRLKTLQTAHAGPLRLLASVAAHSDLESAIHTRFAAYWIKGEWFRLEPDLAAFIAAINDGANPVALVWQR